MPTDSLSFADLKGAVKTLLDTVPNVGTVETRVGGMRSWNSRPGSAAPFWELSVTACLEERAGVGPQAFERPVIRIEGYMPFSYPEDSETTWDTLLKNVRDTLRQYFPALAGLGATGLRGTGLPQLVSNRVEPYETEHPVNLAARNTKLVHHCVIELVGERHFLHALSTSI